MKLAAILGACLLANGAMAATPPVHAPIFDPRAHRDFAGPATEILVLGTPHLSGLPESFTLASLAPVLDRLATWKPDIITIEAVSGPECEMLLRYKARYGDAFDSYCWDLASAEKATGLNVVAATAEVQKRLDAWPASPSPADRRRLAATFIAAGDRASALVQWLRLPVAERHEGEGLNAELAAILKKGETSRNENYAIAAALAARLGLERVYQTDDHSSDATVANLGKGYEDALTRIWSGPATAARLAGLKAGSAKLGSPAATLDLYRDYNRPEAAADAYSGDFGAALKDSTPELYGRRYVSWWEVRNLRMVANIRAATVSRPGARVLTIVGASHKGYFEAYLDMMHDIRLVDAEKVLR